MNHKNENMKTQTNPPSSKLKKYLFISSIFLLVSLSLISSLYFYFQYQKAQKKLQNPQSAFQEETEKIIEQVSRLIDLPEDETPTIATISDKEKLANQPFFDKAKEGDKLLIFTGSKKAILYDPKRQKIIDVTTINVGTSTPSAQTQTISPTIALSAVKFILLNGTEISGLTKKYESELEQKLPQAEVVDRDNAVNRNYNKTLLIALKSNNQDQANSLAKTLAIELATLPANETATSSAGGSADFLIIVGEDKK